MNIEWRMFNIEVKYNAFYFNILHWIFNYQGGYRRVIGNLQAALLGFCWVFIGCSLGKRALFPNKYLTKTQ